MSWDTEKSKNVIVHPDPYMLAHHHHNKKERNCVMLISLETGLNKLPTKYQWKNKKPLALFMGANSG